MMKAWIRYPFRKPAIALIICIALLLPSGPGFSQENRKEEVMVFTPMSMKKPMHELAELFEREHPDISVMYNCAGSGILAQQIISGAPADIVVLSSSRDLALVEEKGMVVKDSRFIFARNAMVLVTPRTSRVKIRGFKDLGSRDVRRIAIGNPKTVSAGLYAEDIFSHYGIKDSIRDKLIFGEQVAQVCDYVVRGEVDAGIVFFSDYLSRKEDLAFVEKAPPGSHRPVEYFAAMIAGSRHKASARAFLGFLHSAEAAVVLEENGFMTVKQE